MDFSGFCKPFYRFGGKKAFILRGIDGQAKIAEFFLTKALLQSTTPALTYGDDSFRKWFTGDRRVPADIWAEIAKTLNTSSFAEEISAVLNEKFLMKVATDFEISFDKGVVPEKDALSSVIAQQFLEIARGDGEAYNVMNELYHSAFSYSDYTEYITKTWNKFSKMKTLLYTESEHDFYEFFVCNDVLTMSSLNLQRIPSRKILEAIERGDISEEEFNFEMALGISERGIIKDATMEKLAKVSRYSLLVGMGGIGKSMMMRHLFLSSNREYSKNGILPILVILREFNPETTDLINMTTDSVRRYDPSFNVQQLKILLANGKCRLLLDGLDEIKSSDTNLFLKQLEVLIDQYPDNQIVMSTRRFSSFIELSRFSIMEMKTFTRKQSLELIEKLQYCPEEPKLKEQFVEKLKNDYFKSHKEFVNNPLLLTLMLMSYHRFAGIPEKRHLFYAQAYDTLLMRHDSGKLYNRVFHSVNDPSEFTKVFREFCARSYRKHDYEFDRQKFEMYFQSLKSVQWVEKKKMTLDNFIYDVCHSACLMYEEGQTYHFLHRSFQEYFFADYYSHKDYNTLQKLTNSLLKAKHDPYEDAGAFLMMYDLEPENIERYILYPYLRNIFDNGLQTENEQFWRYILLGYSECQFVVLNQEAIEQHSIDPRQIKSYERSGGLMITSVLQIKLLRMLSTKYSLPQGLSTLSPDETFRPSLMLLLGHQITDKKTKVTEVFFVPVPEKTDERSSFDRLRRDTSILNKSGEPIVFGYVCTILFSKMLEDPDKYSRAIAIWEDENSSAKAEFREIKQLYELFKQKYEHADDMDDDDF